MHFTLNTLSGATKLEIDADSSTAVGTLIRLVEMMIKAVIRGKGQAEHRLTFHCDSLMVKGDPSEGFSKWPRQLRHSTERVSECFEDPVSATIMMGSLGDGDEENEDGATLRDWCLPPMPTDGGEVEDAKGKKRTKQPDDTGSKRTKLDTSANPGSGTVKVTVLSLVDGVALPMELTVDAQQGLDVQKTVQEIETSYVENRRANTIRDSFGLWEAERPVEITSFLFFGMANRPVHGSFVKTVDNPMPEHIPLSDVTLKDGDYLAFRYKRAERTAQTLKAFPEDFVRTMGAIGTLQADKPVSAHANRAQILKAAKSLVHNRYKGHPQEVKVYENTFTVTENSKIIVLDPSNKVDDGALRDMGQTRLDNARTGVWRVGVMLTKIGSNTQWVENLVVCHESFESVQGLSALIKKKGTSGWKKAGNVILDSTFAGIFSENEFQPGNGERDDPGQYPQPSFQNIAMVPEGVYCRSMKGDGEYNVYTKERGGQIQAVKIVLIAPADFPK